MRNRHKISCDYSLTISIIDWSLGCAKQKISVGSRNIIFPPDEPCQSYTGDIINGVPWGNGTMIWRHGGSYVGQWKNNQKNGFGNLIYTIDDQRNDYCGKLSLHISYNK
jgi:hypothetical protein